MNSIFISGAAQGIGAAVATLFYKQGYKVGIYDLNTEKAQQLANNLGEHAKAGLLDVSNYAQWQSALAEFNAWAGQINILVNNAGILSQPEAPGRAVWLYVCRMAGNADSFVDAY